MALNRVPADKIQLSFLSVQELLTYNFELPPEGYGLRGL